MHALNPQMQMELRLQHAMLHALLLGDAVSARRAWKGAGRYAPQPFYPRLAEAAVLATEGHPDHAAQALAEWEREAERSGRRAQLEVGNLWALERLRMA